MKKVRVLKEMPFAKVGDVIDTKLFPCDLYFFLTKNKYIEWVEEPKSLEEKFDIFLGGGFNARRGLAQIAREHYLGVVDEASAVYAGEQYHGDKANHIRKALEEC